MEVKRKERDSKEIDGEREQGTYDCLKLDDKTINN